MKIRTGLFFVSIFLALTVGPGSASAMADRTDWYIDAVNGDDANGIGSVDKPFKSIGALLSLNDLLPDFVNPGDAIYLAEGNYAVDRIEVDIAELRIEGALNKQGKPISVLGEMKIAADGVVVANCAFFDAGLTLQNVAGVSVSNNLFSGATKNSLTLLGASYNIISRNRFGSSTESCVVIDWDPKSKKQSRDNIFQENYFTHHPNHVTKRIALINSNSQGKKRVSARNRFIECAFEETIPRQLERVIEDRSNWRMVENHGYSIRFEDCYFKKADRSAPFGIFIVTGEHPDLNWYWDELVNDTWVATNDGDNLTGNRKNKYTPVIQFIDGDGDGAVLKMQHGAGVFSSEWLNKAPVVANAVADIAVYENAPPDTVNLFDVFDDDETADENLRFTVSSDNPSLLSYELNDGILMLSYAKDSTGMATVTVSARDDDRVKSQTAEDSFLVVVVEDALIDRSDWHVDKAKGNDANGTGSESNPFKTIGRVFSLNEENPGYLGMGDTIHLGKGTYDSRLLEINIPGVIIRGTLDNQGRPLTVLGETEITADEVKLMNCEISNASLTLQNVERAHVLNNVFSGTTPITLYLLGASNNTIKHNEFKSAEHDSVHIYWDPESGKSSNDNVFLRNYFTHRTNGITRRVVRAYWHIGNNESISARNRFVGCAFKETASGKLKRVIDDESTWWMVADHEYSVQFEDCYFKRADRANPFSEFVILKGYPEFTWRWDELIDDTWVSTNNYWAITGDHKGWGHKPRVQFVDKNGNDKVLEIVYSAGLLSVEQTGPSLKESGPTQP